MAPASAAAALLFQALAVAVMAMALQLSAAAAAAAAPPEAAPIGKPGCETTCGNVSVPYPFGISPGCFWPGLNLTCDRTSDPPRLLLGDGTLRVTNISLYDTTVRVMSTGPIIKGAAGGDGDSISAEGWKNASFGSSFTDHGYLLSGGNELVVLGCNVVALLFADDVGVKAPGSIASCASLCSIVYGGEDSSTDDVSGPTIEQCTGTSGCCQSSVTTSGTVQAKRLYNGCDTVEVGQAPMNVFVAEKGWIHQLPAGGFKDEEEIPFLLRWSVTQGVRPRPQRIDDADLLCDDDVGRMLCKSEHSICLNAYQAPGYKCYCENGYDGNPYLAGPGGCQDIDECAINMALSDGKVCYGVCVNFPGTYKCRCPRGSYGNPFKRGGCSYTGLIIGVAIGPTLLLLVPGIILLLRWMKQRKAKLLKQKYFKQNRGYLLQQLLSQEADIAERMIIPVDELAKATNNFDKARELGVGGHGTVYKGILSNLRVVAIKKPKTLVQKEIDEFINEVAILSQINHRNVVKLFGCCLETEVPLLVYEFISNGTLYDHLHDTGPRSLSWGNRLRIATEVATSLAYLHSAVSIPIIHRDIKSANILLDDTLTSKVADFGASKYIPIEKTGLTTRVQGTRGYLDPMYFYTGRLTEKSDVYSFGVILVELLTRKKPFSYVSTEGDGLVVHFVDLITAGNLAQILDPQVIEEGAEEVQEVAALAALCINLRGEERPTMRQVEHTLEGLWGFKRYRRDDPVAAEFNDDSIVTNCALSTKGGEGFKESSRRYSLEQEMMMSARYPR